MGKFTKPNQLNAKKRKNFLREIGGALFPHQLLRIPGDEIVCYAGGFIIDMKKEEININVYKPSLELLTEKAKIMSDSINILGQSVKLNYYFVEKPVYEKKA